MANQTSNLVCSDFLLGCKDDVLKVKGLFRERKYRRCAVLCSQALQDATHPLHRTFLCFYQAVCYENLGHISHDYSGNKIPLLEQARDSFISANDLLPLPFLTRNNGEYNEPKASPMCATDALLDFYCDSPPIYADDTPFGTLERRGRSFTRSTQERLCEDISMIYAIPDFNDYSPRVPLGELKGNDLNRRSLVSTPKNAVNHKARLSRSLSSQHVLAEELVPSPLYSRAPSSRKEMQPFIVSTASPIPLVTLGKPLPPTPINRPLPTLPFNHYPNFILKGKRIVIAPRKTALSTLIQKFERRSPFDVSPGQCSAHESIPIEPTPTTERFKRISTVFASKTDKDKENQPPETPFRAVGTTIHKHPPPITPCPNPHLPRSHLKKATRRLEAQNPSHLELYNNHLSSFRASLLTHIATVSDSIAKTRTIQQEHEAEKRRNFAAMNSRARNVSSIPAPSRSKSRGRSAIRTSRLSPMKDARLRSFWSLQAAEASERANTNGTDRKAKERRERIDRLKKNGWKDVRKEAKGWKGAAYYEELRRSADEELRAAER